MQFHPSRLMRVAAACAALIAAPRAALADDCQALVGKMFGDGRVVSVDNVEPPTQTANLTTFNAKWITTAHAPFCRVHGVLTPSTDSYINFEVWLPTPDHWNGTYRGVGNGGFAGAMFYTDMGGALEQGYATSGTDTGHFGLMNESGWAVGHPEKMVDMGWRSIHETAVAAKAIVQAYYGKAPAHSYYAGCSTGGRQGLLLAQRFPDDYDGIVVGAPAAYWPRLLASDATIAKSLLEDPQRWVSPAKLALVNKTVLAACKTSGGLIEDPGRCNFRPETLACKNGADSDSCLTVKEIATLNLVYHDLRDANGELIYPGWAPGNEVAFSGAKFGSSDRQAIGAASYAFPTGFYGNWLHQDPSWTVRQFDITKDLPTVMNGPIGKMVYAENPDLSAFKARGGKLIQYHGWHDPSISAKISILYFESVAERQGGIENTNSFYRLFLGTGMEHCGGGPGPNVVGGFFAPPPSHDPEHDVVSALRHWVEDGVAPEKLIATRYKDNNPANGVEAQRPWCNYPKIARYDGRGDSTKAESYQCKAPPRK